MLFPIGLAFLAIPLIINGLGVVKFGLLTICWAILGYFGFLDFGVSRSLTNTVARYRGLEIIEKAWESCWTAIITLSCVFVPLALVIHALREPITGWLLNPPADLEKEVVVCVGLIGLSLPVVVLTGVVKGALEGFERFDITNIIRLPMAIWSYAGPVLLLPFTQSMVDVVLFLMLGRAITLVLFAISLNQIRARANLRYSKEALKDLFKTGGWIGLSTLMSPLMIFIDRFVLAAKITLGQVAYYTTPMDAVTKLLQPVDAVAGVFFPALSRVAHTDEVEFARLYALLADILFLLVLPCALILGVFSHEILSVWISSSFADESSRVLSVLTIGVFANASARAPWMALQSIGQAKYTAYLQFVELLPYGAALFWACGEFGVMGAACVWSMRVVIDATLLFVAAGNGKICRIFYLNCVLLAASVIGAWWLSSFFLKALFAFLLVLVVLIGSFSRFGISRPSDFISLMKVTFSMKRR